MSVQVLKRCMFCGSTDGAYNEICNYCYMIYQDEDDLNNYIKKFNELQEAKIKLLEGRKN